GALYAAGRRLPLPAGRVIDLPGPRWRHARHWWTDGKAGAAPERLGAVEHDAAPQATRHSPVVTRLIHHIAAVSGHSPSRIAPTTAVTDLGLDSLMAVRVRTAVEREFGVELSLRDLLGAATVAEAATRVEQALPQSAGGATPRPLRATGSRPPLFLVHAAGGPTTVYKALAEALDAEQPVFGLDRIDEARTVTEKARRYAEAIDAARPNGPLLLGGWSFGGFVAQEAARQLAAAGRDIPLVVLIDSVRPLPRPGLTAGDRIRAHFEGFAGHVAETYGVRPELPYDDLAAMDDDRDRIDTVLRAVREAVDVPPAALAHQRASYLDLRIGEAHRPGRYEGPVLLYRATEPAPHTVRDPAYERDDETLGWDEVCPELAVVQVKGHHLALLDPPCVDEIATHLDRALAERAPAR
ncbi:MAG: non-ribosomal peptide synthetase, partial [Streptomyces sp.]|nr:non-ribosomal peptide synthetase [Streptomyces sp.]